MTTVDKTLGGDTAVPAWSTQLRTEFPSCSPCSQWDRLAVSSEVIDVQAVNLECRRDRREERQGAGLKGRGLGPSWPTGPPGDPSAVSPAEFPTLARPVLGLKLVRETEFLPGKVQQKFL